MRTRIPLSGLLVAAAAACAEPSIPDFPRHEIARPDTAGVEAVVFLVGDAGYALPGRSPVLERLERDVARWVSRLGGDGAVSVVYLGDVVYPVGLRDRDDPAFETDSVHLWSQVEILASDSVRGLAHGIFLAGNHDWGNLPGEAGVRRLENLERALTAYREQGIAVRLAPAAGLPGPVYTDVGEHLRLIFLDTHWFLQQREAVTRVAFLIDLGQEIASAGERHVVIAAHHPYISAGAHGATAPISRAIGIAWLLSKSGALVQDLNSPIYSELREGLRTVFAETGPPLAFVGGHDHSLQVLETSPESPDPWYALVSGAGSKLSPIEDHPGLLYGAVEPGFMTVVSRRDGSADLYVTTGAPDRLSCPPESGEETVEAAVEAAAPDAEPESVEAVCMERALERFRLAYSTALAGPRPPVTDPDSVPTPDREVSPEPDPVRSETERDE